MPEANNIPWKGKCEWMGDYLLHGRDGMTVHNQIAMISSLKTEQIDEEQIHYACIFTLVDMGYTLSALREFFGRKEIKVRPDVLKHYRRCVARSDPFGSAPLELEGPFFDFMILLKDFIETPQGTMSYICNRNMIWVTTASNSYSISISPCLKEMGSFAVANMLILPSCKEIRAHIKSLLDKDDFIIRYDHEKFTIWLKLDWCVRHNLFPRNWTSHLRKRR